MGLKLLQQRDGSLREDWYAEYVDGGKRRVVNLGIRWRGTPPASGRVGDEGDQAFEVSRAKAESELARITDEVKRKGQVEHIAERLIESKTGEAVKYVRISELDDKWRAIAREVEPTERHLDNCKAHFKRFVEYMQTRNPKAQYIYEVTTEDATGFNDTTRALLSRPTFRYGMRLLKKAFAAFLPAGSKNPFAAKIAKSAPGESGVIHRKPFTAEQLRAILDESRKDKVLHPLVVAAMCTGMRRGDVCTLKWDNIDLDAGEITITTSKTEGDATIPIFPPLLEVLGDTAGTGFVFPEAERMLRVNRHGLTKRFKAIVARAIGGWKDAVEPEPVPAAEIAEEGAEAIRKHVLAGERRERMLEVLRRYAAGQSVRKIEREVGCVRATVSADIHAVEQWIGKPFLRRKPGRHTGKSIAKEIARVTRIERGNGELSHAASVYDFHSLRTTFITLALSAGVQMELVRRITGHKTVEVVLRHYFRPDRQHFKTILNDALPSVLTGKSKKAKRLPGGNNLQALAAKVAAGTATQSDRAKLASLLAG